MATEAAWRPQTPRPHSAPELVLIANHTVAYTGPYAINASFVPPADDPGLGAVVHGPLTVVEDPVDVGTTFTRYFRLLEGGRVLRLLLAVGGLGSNTSSTLFWERVA